MHIKLVTGGAAAIVLYNKLGVDKIIEMIIKKKDNKNKIMYPHINNQLNNNQLKNNHLLQIIIIIII